MAEITAAMVRDLREKTGAGMMDCKKALVETNGDMEAAIDWLRKKGLSAAAKKSGRVAAEGLVAVASDRQVAAMVEVNCRDRLRRPQRDLPGFVEGVAKLALTVGEDVEALKAAQFPGTGHTTQDELTRLISTIGENMTIRRARVLRVGSGAVAPTCTTR
jgi:elongation factor Ts